MKKISIIVLTFVMVGLFGGCASKEPQKEDLYAGNYVYVTAEEKLAVASQISTLIENTKNTNTEMISSSHATVTEASRKTDIKMGANAIFDYTDPDHPIAYQKFTMEIKQRDIQYIVFMEMDMYVDVVEDKIYIDYYACTKLGNRVLEEIRVKGYEIYSESEGESASEMMALNQINSQLDLETILNNIQFSEVDVSISNNKIKIVEIGKTEGDATYYIINDNDSFRAKKEMVLRNVANTGADLFHVTEIMTTDKTTSLPGNLEEYSEKIDWDNLIG